MKRLALAALLLALAMPLCAQETSRFLIERIDVRHLVHASADVVKSESRLHEGASYTESELRDANHRIKRLPFVLDAAFSLEKGSVRDAYVLVITVNETRPFFYLLDLVYFKKAGGLSDVDSTDAAILGGRIFAGRNDVVHLALVEHKDDRPFESNYSSIQAGYTRYGLFDGRVFASFTIDRNLPTGPQEQPKTQPGAVVGVSLSPNRTLTVSYSAVDLSSTRSRHAERMLEARFAYNTTDHPFFPNEGSLLSVAPLFVRTDVFSSAQPLIHSQDVGVEAEVARYVPLTDRFTFAADANGGLVREQQRGASFTSRTARYGAAFLKLSRRMGALDSADSDHRIELTLRGVSKQHDFFPIFRDASTQLSVTWVRRSAWGILRLGVGYAR